MEGSYWGTGFRAGRTTALADVERRMLPLAPELSDQSLIRGVPGMGVVEGVGPFVDRGDGWAGDGTDSDCDRKPRARGELSENGSSTNDVAGEPVFNEADLARSLLKAASPLCCARVALRVPFE